MLLVSGCTQINPDEIGVRTVNFGPAKGLVQKDYDPGFHRYLWPLDTWHRFPSTIQQMSFSGTQTRAGQRPTALEVTSADGDRVAVHAEAFFRIGDNAAHKVLQDSGPGDRYLAVVRNLSQDVARVALGRLRTEDFYQEQAREQAREQGVEILRERLDQRGIELVDLSISKVEFDPMYEGLIKEKKLADQTVELEKAKARAAEEKGKVENIRAESAAKVQKVARETEAELTRINTETQMQVAALQAEANKYARQVKADADLYFAEKQAAGQKLIARAEAEGTRARNDALSGEGSENLVAMEALKKLNLVDVTFPSLGFEWFNPVNMALRVGASHGEVDSTLSADTVAGKNEPDAE
jgi:regulator of protease activity HflC (stomatin/prohibitin superfamily)